MVGATKVSNIYWMCLETMLLEGNQIAESVYEAKKIICPLGIEVEKNPCMQEQLCIVPWKLCIP
jgi:hypothetical protein